ncbi:AP-3 complex subunit beta-2 [Plutella xylostella]|uniref:AP-3 complex subunit beta-2 n=1 Tax=Plutella xylostella TaxID=51655 RepID=UPI0020331A7E|nr:AP-3 complex subunit beta-2 [Plutella xylostella]
MSGVSSYNNDKVVTGEVEYPASDPASGAFFQPDYKKNEDLKMMLDGSKDSLKLEAMKRIIGMIAKGRDASDLFPAVVKNVVSKNIEVKKLVYVYLVRYAEEQQDLALLSISTFQRALKDPNQLIRASALRVLSSIRVSMIVPIVMLAIRDSAADMSPYVRKTAAHAIPKLYSLDPEQKEELVSIIDRLLADKAPLVVGSAAMAFSEVCTERMTLIHKSFRKLCLLLADVDEWGQLALLNVLTVYAKTYFPDPNEAQSSSSESDKPFYDSDSDTPRDGPPRRRRKSSSDAPGLDADHRLLLRAAKPLLQSRNAGVVMAVAQLFYHCGPNAELPPVAKALIRLLRAPLEVQSVVLNTIASLTVNKRALFEPFLKSFFVRTSDPTHIKLLKLEILTNLATQASAPTVLRELQTYVTSNDKQFAAATIQAIGRLALSIGSETETCLNGLLQLLSSKDECIVCEAVVVVKRVVGGGAASARAAVARASKLLRSDRLAGNARAAAVWLVAEHGAKLPRAAAVLAHMAATFPEQDELVKLQLLTLAIKLSITQPDTLPLGQYIVQLARYDTSYDVRDRARMLGRFLTDEKMRARGATVFLEQKPAATTDSSFKDRQQYTVGTLSHYIGAAAGGYRPLPASPATAIGAELRAQPTPAVTSPQEDKKFYSRPNSSGSRSSSGSGSSSEESSSEESSDEEASDDEEEEKKPEKKKETNNIKSTTTSSASDSESDSSDSEESYESSDNSDDPKSKGDKTDSKPTTNTTASKKNEKSNLELLLELDSVASSLPTMTPTCGGLLSPSAGPAGDDTIKPVPAMYTSGEGVPLLSRVSCGGLSATVHWTRKPHLYGDNMLVVGLNFTNHNSAPLQHLRVGNRSLGASRMMHEFLPISTLEPGATIPVTIGLDFADSIQPIEFVIACSLGEFTASIKPPVGELMQAVTMTQERWDKEQKKLRGMNECEKKASKMDEEQAICQRVYETANVAPITATGELLRFAGRLMSSKELVLLSVKIEDSTLVRANCSNMAIASLLANQIAQAFAR